MASLDWFVQGWPEERGPEHECFRSLVRAPEPGERTFPRRGENPDDVGPIVSSELRIRCGGPRQAEIWTKGHSTSITHCPLNPALAGRPQFLVVEPELRQVLAVQHCRQRKAPLRLTATFSIGKHRQRAAGASQRKFSNSIKSCPHRSSCECSTNEPSGASDNGRVMGFAAVVITRETLDSKL